MKKQIISVDENRDIIVIDDAFIFSEISGIYNQAINYKYSIYNSSESEVQDLVNKRLGCPLEIGDPLIQMCFGDSQRRSMFEEYVSPQKYFLWRSYINLGIHSDNHKIHVDDFSIGDGKTVLVYLNRNWDLDWGGETVFYGDDRKEIKYVSQYIPGRIIVFDASIPHSAKPQHFNAPPYRFTMATKFLIHEKMNLVKN